MSQVCVSTIGLMITDKIMRTSVKADEKENFYLKVVVVVAKRIFNGLGHFEPADKKDKLEERGEVVNEDKRNNNQHHIMFMIIDHRHGCHHIRSTLRMRKMGTKV